MAFVHPLSAYSASHLASLTAFKRPRLSSHQAHAIATKAVTSTKSRIMNRIKTRQFPSRALYQPGLGLEFAMEVDACLDRVRQSPEMYARVKKNYRRVMVHRFPFAIYYEFDGVQAVVLTVFHCSQDPAKLDQRLS